MIKQSYLPDMCSLKSTMVISKPPLQNLLPLMCALLYIKGFTKPSLELEPVKHSEFILSMEL